MKDKNFEKTIYESLKMVAPGTLLRAGLENIIRAKTGALIVVGNGEEVLKIVDGGFYINTQYSPEHLYELAKMDGAIILSSDLKTILYANAQLIPNQSIASSETGTRHRTAERVAKQVDALVIAISERRNIITLYKKNMKYILKNVNQILTKANQAIQTLEKYKNILNQVMYNLTVLEFKDLVTMFDVSKAIQRIEMVTRVSMEIEKYILELGNEGRLIKMQLNEIINGVEQDKINMIKDYCKNKQPKLHENVKKSIEELTSEQLLNLDNIAKIFGYNDEIDCLNIIVHPKGYRILSKIPKIPLNVLENVIDSFAFFQKILKASISELNLVEGIGEIRSRTIKEGLRRFQEKIFLERHLF